MATSRQNLLILIRDLKQTLKHPLRPEVRSNALNAESRITKWNDLITSRLKECIAAQQWNSALKLLEVLVHMYKATGHLLFKNSLYVLHNTLQQQNTDSISSFLMKSKLIPNVGPAELKLTKVGESLTNGHLEEASEQYRITRTRSRTKASEQEAADIDLGLQEIIEIYNGIIEYAKWKQLVGNPSDEDRAMLNTSNLNRSTNSNCGGLAGEAKNHAHLAIQFWRPLIENGNTVADIVLDEYTELLDFYDFAGEALVSIESFAEKNGDDVIAWIRLFLYYVDQSCLDCAKSTKILTVVSRLSPSESIIPQLAQIILQQSGDMELVVTSIFNYLDYSTNEDDLKAWKLLAEVLEDCFANRLDLKTTDLIKHLWRQRENVLWNDCRFAFPLTSDVQSEADLALLVEKAIVHSYLNQSRGGFAEYVLDLVQRSNSGNQEQATRLERATRGTS